MAWSEHTSKCPYCEKQITLPVERWSTEEKCPECGNLIDIEYDMSLIYDENGHIEDEWDLYEFKKITR